MYIKVRVYPGSKEESLKKPKEDLFEIKVKEKAELNMANKRVTLLLSRNLNLPANKIRLISGHHSPNKIFNIMK